MTKATGKRKHVIEGLPTVSERACGRHGGQQAGRADTGAVAENSPLTHKQEAESGTGSGVGFWNLRALPQQHTSSKKPTLLTLPKQFTN